MLSSVSQDGHADNKGQWRQKNMIQVKNVYLYRGSASYDWTHSTARPEQSIVEDVLTVCRTTEVACILISKLMGKSRLKTS